MSNNKTVTRTSSTTVIRAGWETFFVLLGFNLGALSALFRFRDEFDILSYLLRPEELEARWCEISRALFRRSTLEALPVALVDPFTYSML